MIILVLFAFLGGIITVLSPCILPILPIILSSSVGGGKNRPYGVIAGFVISFTFFTLFLSLIVKQTGLAADSLRLVSVGVLILFGLTLLIPQIQAKIELVFARLSRLAPRGEQVRSGFMGGVVIGASLGLLWTPCVGPILASVISLALIGEVNSAALIITLAYSTGTAIPMFMIVYGGQNALLKAPWLVANTGKIQKAFGAVMVLTAAGIYLNVDRKFQTYVLEKFPKYGTGLTRLEDNELVQKALKRFGPGENEEMIGKSLDTIEYPLAPEIVPGGEWFNSEPLTLEELQGKVVLIDFWTYSCINCIRTLPYLRAWHEKYEADGLVIIGVHTPEFEFEKDPENLQRAIDDFGLRYPIVQDNNYETWRAYNNRFWPAKYLIDKEGRIRYTHFGEGEYDEAEKKIQELLSEAGAQVQKEIANPSYQVYNRTPETYLGYKRSSLLVPSQSIAQDVEQEYGMPEIVRANKYALGGKWTVTPEYAKSGEGAELAINFEAKEVFLVMRSEEEAKVEVFLDDEDVAREEVVVSTDKLYKLIELQNPGRHILKLKLEPGAEVFAFTFG